MNYFFETLAGQGIFSDARAEKIKASAGKVGLVIGAVIGFFVGLKEHNVGALIIGVVLGGIGGFIVSSVAIAVLGFIGMVAIYLVPLAAAIGILMWLFNLKF